MWPSNSILCFLKSPGVPVRAFFSLLVVGLLAGCGPEEQAGKPVQDIVKAPEKVNEHVVEALQIVVSGIDTAKPLIAAKDTLLAAPFIAELYKGRNFAQLWSDKGKRNKQGDTLLKLLLAARDYGLVPAHYHAPLIDSLFRTAKDSSGSHDAIKLADADLLLSNAFFTFAVHVSKGRFFADSLTPEWHPEKLDTNLVQLLTATYEKNAFRATFDSLEPKQFPYRELKRALKKFRAMYEGKTWDTLPTVVPDTNAFKLLLKKRLIASHDYDSTISGTDSVKLVKAIKSFQRKHALHDDGKLGKNTFKAMNVSIETRIRQAEMNLERWRWEPAKMPERYAWLNIPGFHFAVIEADTMVMESRVIVGTVKNQTPVQVGKIRYFLIYPYWRVPYSIAWKEILPAVKRDTSYLRKHNFEVLQGGTVIDHTKLKWSKYSKSYLPFTFRQREGEDNSLGVMKFNFDNKYGVYLHDTNSKRLFGKESRALSHGCMRLEKYMDFANFLIRDDSLKYRPDSILLYLEKKEKKQIDLKKPINIYVKYFTANADEHGNLFFFADIYGKDEKMIRAMYKD